MSNNELKEFQEYQSVFQIQSIDDLNALFEKIYEIDDEFIDFCPRDIFKENTGVYKRIFDIVGLCNFPLTIVYDRYYVDKVYRDEFYEYYAKKHFSIFRNTKRFILINNSYSRNELLSNDCVVHNKIENDLIGMIVIKPTKTIGRVLINPYKINIPKLCVLTSNFDITVLGRIYSMKAFPSSGQDIEVMTCAEVNIWQIMEYYGQKYDNYRTLLPSELRSFIKDNSEVRMLPSDGLTDEQESFLFLKNGFSPKIYYKREFYEDNNQYMTRELFNNPTFDQILHLYVESGIPILINLRDKGDVLGERHSITCIGFEKTDTTQVNAKIKNFIDNPDALQYNGMSVAESWDQKYKYIFMEDHSKPYFSLSLDDIIFPETGIEWEIESFVAPLYKHVFVSAEDACVIMEEVISKTTDLVKKCLSDDSELFLKLFLVPSRAYKNFRINNTDSIQEKVFFSQMNYPKYLWICEYGNKESFSNNKAIGEYIIDATSSKQDSFESIISTRHGRYVSFRKPNESVNEVLRLYDIDMDSSFELFSQEDSKS